MKIIRSKSGHINVKSTLKTFQAELDRRVQEEHLLRNDESMKKIVVATLATTKGFPVSLQFLAIAIVRELHNAPDNGDYLLERAKKYLRLNGYKEGIIR